MGNLTFNLNLAYVKIDLNIVVYFVDVLFFSSFLNTNFKYVIYPLAPEFNNTPKYFICASTLGPFNVLPKIIGTKSSSSRRWIYLFLRGFCCS